MFGILLFVFQLRTSGSKITVCTGELSWHKSQPQFHKSWILSCMFVKTLILVPKKWCLQETSPSTVFTIIEFPGHLYSFPSENLLSRSNPWPHDRTSFLNARCDKMEILMAVIVIVIEKKCCWIRRVQPTRCSVSQFIYFCETFYTFQTTFPSIIRCSKLHIQHQVFVRQLLLPAASLSDQYCYLLLACQTSTATCC